MKKTIGEVLKFERKKQNLTLDDIQQKAKVQKKYLQLIENDQFDLLPSTFYTRAFIRQYAKAVGLDDQKLIDAYASERLIDTAPENEQSNEKTSVSTMRIEENSSKTNAAPSRTAHHTRSWLDHLPGIILSLFALIIICVVILVVIQQKEMRNNANNDYSIASSSSSKTSTSESSTEPSSSVEMPKENVIAITGAEGNTINATATNVTSPAKITITAKDNARSWVSILDNDTQANLLGYTGTNGNIIGSGEAGGMTQEATLDTTNKKIKISIGNKPNISVTVNGSPIDLSKVENTVTYIILTISYST